MFLYERFAYAYFLSMKINKDEKLYTLFKKILLLNTNSVIDNSLYEDIIRAIFLNYSGVFLNFDKIFLNIFKIHKEEEFNQFLLDLNKHVFDE